MKNNNDIITCGIDVSKKNLDAFIGNRVKTYDNSLKGFKKLMNEAGDVHYVFESTGGYEREAAWFLLRHNRKVSIVNPQRVRAHAKSKGKLAKTDHIDAKIITDYADSNELRLTEMPSDEQVKLTTLVDRRSQLEVLITMEKNHLEAAYGKEHVKSVKTILRTLQKEKAKVEKDIHEVICLTEELKSKSEAIQDISGLGEVCAMVLLAYLPELGKVSRQEVAALTGLAPYNRDSGSIKGCRHINGGRGKIRKALYMAAMSATVHNPIMKEFYNRLVKENHRPKKVALVAVMRKLVIASNYAVKKSEFMLAN